MRRNFGSTLAVMMSLGTACTPAWAYDLKPIVIQLAPSGGGASQMIMVTNTEDAPIAIEAKTFQRTQSRDGTEMLEPENEDIILAPPQMIIPPKTSQTFKVQWIGNPRPDKELAFRLITEQLQIELPEAPTTTQKTADVRLQYRYEAALYITPAKSAPALTVDGAELVKDDKGAPMLKLSLTNGGTRRAIPDKPELTLTPGVGGNAVTLSGDQLNALAGKNILAGESRDILMPWPEALPQGPVTASLKTSFIVLN